jgi:diketogulonate reductase-like aldo/keto reductase
MTSGRTTRPGLREERCSSFKASRSSRPRFNRHGYGVTVPQLCIRYCLQLGMLPLQKTTKAAHMLTNAAVDFEISEADMEALKSAERIRDYGKASRFPVYGGRT